jgi:S-adenosylmethionine:tRNA ribosyltransferase-isomerase
MRDPKPQPVCEMAGKAMNDQTTPGPPPSGTDSLSAGAAFARDDFQYHLPDELIAQAPSGVRGDSRLLALTGANDAHRHFSDLPDLLLPGDLLIVNDTRVVKARLQAEKDSGGRAEILLERVESERVALCQVRVSKSLKSGRTLTCGSHRLSVLGRSGEFYRLEFPVSVLDVFEELGSVPLPPYIERQPDTVDEERYQTIWSAEPGAVAAPTAGLHFSEPVLARVREIGVRIEELTLHVGAGTFQPVRSRRLTDHKMHREHFEIGEDTALAVEQTKNAGGRVVAVGTTVVRALESAATASGRVQPGSGETALFITPGYQFRIVDALVTNFHLPESTLLMLVCAFGGYQRVMRAYESAVAEGYRFFSYGDAMFVERSQATAGQGRSR